MPAAPVTLQASASGGRINGIVRDEVGGLVGGVNVVAMGTSLAAVQTDGAGRFSLSLPASEYILRATRPGYVSTYREPVRVLPSVPLERNITLLRQSTADEQPLAETRGQRVAAAKFGAAAKNGGEGFGAKQEFSGEIGAIALRFVQLALALLRLRPRQFEATKEWCETDVHAPASEADSRCSTASDTLP